MIVEMENWFEKYERKKDEKREKELNYLLNELLLQYDTARNNKELIKILEKIIEIYDTMKTELLEYDAKDYLDKKKQLANLRYEKLQEEHRNSDEFQSWNEYREEEEKEDERDLR